MIIDFIKASYMEILMIAPFICVGFFAIYINIIRKILKKIRCSEPVKGRIIDIRQVRVRSGRRERTVYKPTCTYEYNGVNYDSEVEDSIGVFDQEIGDEYEFKINPKKPTEAMKFYVLDGISMVFQLPIFCFILLVCISAINTSYRKYVTRTNLVASASETKKYPDGNQSNDNNKDISSDTNADTSTNTNTDNNTSNVEKEYPDNMQKYALNTVNLWLDKEYVVNQDKEDVIVAVSPDKKVKFYMIVKEYTSNKDTIIEQLKNNIVKNNPNAKWMSTRKYNNNNDFDLYSDKINNYYVRYVISANDSYSIFIKYIDTDINNDKLDSLLETITY